MQRWVVPVLLAIVALAGLTTSGGRPDTAAATSVAPPTEEPEALPLAGRTIHLDAGHNGGNGANPSAINAQVDAGGGVRKACDTTGTETNDRKLAESAFTLDVALRLRTRLERYGAKVVMTRTTNTGVGPCITKRAAIGNDAKADAAISIHADGGPAGGRGFHVITPGGVKGQGKTMLADSALLGRRVRTALKAKGYRTATYIAKDGLDRRTDLGGLNLSEVPKVFAELGNMRNAADARILKSGTQRARMADALANAFIAQLGS